MNTVLQSYLKILNNAKRAKVTIQFRGKECITFVIVKIYRSVVETYHSLSKVHCTYDSFYSHTIIGLILFQNFPYIEERKCMEQ